MSGVLVGKRMDDEIPATGFILDDFAFVSGSGVLFDYDRFNLLNPAGVAKLLQTATSLVRKDGPVLRGDPRALQHFRSKADERERLYVEMMARQHSAQR